MMLNTMWTMLKKLLEYFLPQLKGYTMNIKEEKKYE